MSFDAAPYSQPVRDLLALEGGGERLMPLAGGRCATPEAGERLRGASASVWFPGARAPEAARAGLYLYFSCWEEAHRIAQEIPTAEGSYWHAIVHRQEPDPGNAGYWFRRAGAHPIFPALRDQASRIVAAAGAAPLPGKSWDPFAFLDWCEQALRLPGSPLERAALEIQRAEWQLLFAYCAGVR